MSGDRWRRPGVAALLVGLAVIAAIALLRAGGGGDFSTTPAEPAAQFERRAPNVVVVMTDDQAIDTMRALPRTRRLLGGEGVSFENAVASYPLCCPSRATFQTGQYAHNTGVLDNHPPEGGYQAFDAESALPVWLSRAGFRTGFVGKYLNGYGKGDAAREVPPGWSDWYGLPANAKQHPFDFDVNENGELVHYGEDEYKTEVLEEKAIEFIRDGAASRRPFFLWVATDAPHKDAGNLEGAERNPEPAPQDLGAYEDAKAPRPASFNEQDVSDKPGHIKGQRFLNSGEIEEIDKIYRSQLESLIAVDRLVADVVAELRRQGELGDTLLMLTTDHGFLRGHHRVDSGKSSPYEEAIRIPLLVRGPGFPSGVREERLVANVDIAPTILEATGARADVEVDGRSLRAFVDGGADRDRTVLLEVYERKTGNLVGVRTRGYMYAEYEKGGRELYDLKRDPLQLDNLARDPAYSGVRQRLARSTERLRDCAGPSCR